MRAGGSSLSDGQIDCLELIAQNLTSKEIAVRLGISPHTVDKRVRKAIRKLGANDRRQAARLVQQKQRQWQRGPISREQLPEFRLPPAPIEKRAFPLPVATPQRPTNTMHPGERIFWIVAIAIAAGLATFVYLAGLESLGRVLGH